jgi:hypothetical protein
MDTFYLFYTYNLLELVNCVVNTFHGTQLIAGSKGMTGIKTDADP